MPKLVIEHSIPGAGNATEPFVREAGTGPGVVCIHSDASTSAQWRGLMDLLAPRTHHTSSPVESLRPGLQGRLVRRGPRGSRSRHEARGELLITA
jgi:hypothetical protein